MNDLHGFELIREEHIEELNSNAKLFRHVKTGAELLSVENDDENKSFGITFRTPPTDSTGVAHIMEHSVLGGSKKYPVKEPFVELIKGSFKTFLNAFTSSDWTAYPVASTNEKDFYNLVDVYLDAVFHPLITPHHLQQEGWHYEIEKPDAPLVYKGVVFNEMKGAYSSPDGLLYRLSQQELFPGHTYGFDSGGDPTEIPNLTYEDFRTFHETYYHPSNARIFFYGDDELEKRLAILDDYLNDFEAKAVESDVPLAEGFAEPQTAVFPYSVAQNTPESERKAFVQINWALPEIVDSALRMSLSVMSYCLISTQASPLRKTLVDSGLGSDVTGGGLSGNLRQMTFSAGMKGVEVGNEQQVEALILETLQKIAAEGFDPELIEAAFNTFEFNLRENNTGSFPRGLSIMLRSMRDWLYERDPLQPLKFEKPLADVKQKLSESPDYLQELIQTYLLNNTHRGTVILQPSESLQAEQEEAEKARLENVRTRLTEADIASLIEQTEELQRIQTTPDKPEDLAKIPRLTMDDLDKKVKTIPIAVSQAYGSTVLHHDLFTNGILYLEVGFDMHTLPQELLPYVGLFSQSLTQMGTEAEDYVKLSQRIGRKTGGVGAERMVRAVREQQEAKTMLFLSGKSTMAQAQDMLDIIKDIFLTVKLDNQERFRQIVLKTKARREAGLIPSGHQVTNRRLKAQFSEASWFSEQTSGVSNLLFLRDLLTQIEEDWPSVLAKLEAIKSVLVNRNAMVSNVTVDAENWATFRPQLEAFIAEFPKGEVVQQSWRRDLAPANEGLTIPAQVNYVGKGANIYELGYELDGSISVITNFLRTTWLWERVRVHGGAYGGFCAFDRESGVFSQLSYRDPNLLETVDVYDKTADFLRSVNLDESELTKSIIGAISGMDGYQLPDAKGYTSMVRYLLGVTDAERQAYRDQIMSTTNDDFKALADVLEKVNGTGKVVVVGSAEAIQAANEKKGGDWLEVTKVL